MALNSDLKADETATVSAETVLAASPEIVLCLDSCLVIRYLNAAAQRCLGCLQESPVGRNLSEFIAPASLENLLKSLTDCDSTGTNEVEIQLICDQRPYLTLVHAKSQDLFTLVLRDASRAQQRQTVLELYNVVAAEANACVNVQRFIGHCLEMICRFHKWQMGHAFIVEGGPGREQIRSARVWHSSVAIPDVFQNISECTIFPRGFGLPGKVLADQVAVCIPDLSKEEVLFRLSHLRDAGITGVLAVPVKAELETLAILEFYSDQVLKFTPLIAETVGFVAAQLGRVIERQNVSQSINELNLVLQNAVEGIARVDGLGNYISVNRQYADVAGCEVDDLMYRPWYSICYPEDLPRAVAAVDDLSRNSRVEIEMRGIRKDGSSYFVEMLFIADPTRDVRLPAGFYCFMKDISFRKQVEERLFHDAYHDRLTGLANRTLFMQTIERAIGHGKRRKEYRFALLFLDLDDFKNVNDRFGHVAGDVILKQTAVRLNNCLRTGDLACRMGGDEFVVLLDDLKTREEAALVTQRLMDDLCSPFDFEGQSLSVCASIGVYFHEGGDLKGGDIIRIADRAMYEAKQSGKARVRFASGVSGNE